MNIKQILCATLAVAMSAALAACGGAPAASSAASSEASSAASSEASSAASSEASSAASSEASSAASGEASAAGEITGPNIDRIKAAGKIVMCSNLSFPPFEYIGDDGKGAGVDIDISNEIAKDLGVELEVIDMNFDLLIDAVKSGKADFCAAGMTVKPERLEQVDFSTEYVKSAQYVIVKKDSTITADKLDGLTIGVQEATTGDFYATDEVKAKEVLRFKSGIDAGAALKAGKCDAVIIDELPAKSIADNSAGELVTLPDSLTEETYAIAIKKDSADLTAAINATLKRLMDEGKIDQMVTDHMTKA